MIDMHVMLAILAWLAGAVFLAALVYLAGYLLAGAPPRRRPPPWG